jgi:soluble lytic murein transglycosylase-like protein
MSRRISRLTAHLGYLAGLLPSDAAEMSRRAADYTWTPPRDFRVICACQRHGTRRALLHRTKTAARAVARHVHRRTLAVLIGIPLAFGAVGIRATSTTAAFPIFDTRQVREALLHPERAATTFTFDMAKEAFFRTSVPYGSIILREARKNRLQPELIAAVVQAESDFRPGLVSSKSAQGLMQIIPETSRILGCDDPFDPSKNIAAGTKYLRHLVDRFGDERIALAAYNAGEGRVERCGGVPPIAETRQYLDRVNRHTRTYRACVRNRYIAAQRIGIAE